MQSFGAPKGVPSAVAQTVRAIATVLQMLDSFFVTPNARGREGIQVPWFDKFASKSLNLLSVGLPFLKDRTSMFTQSSVLR